MLTDSIAHSIEANIAPTIAKFLPCDAQVCLISRNTSRTVCVLPSGNGTVGVTLAENNPITPPRPKPMPQQQFHSSNNLEINFP